MLETLEAHKQAWGQYFTPAPLASFMAKLASEGVRMGACVRVLDPGAGTGALGLALARELLERCNVERVELHCVESEPQARRELERALAAARREFGRRLQATSWGDDFLEFEGLPPIDIAIGNPPYFKLSPSDPRGGDAPNIYARFMDIAAGLLREGGRLCFVVPRSYASGLYFRRFRRRFHASMQLERVHVFESRRAAFVRDAVLQENIVVSYDKRAARAEDRVGISVSHGVDDLLERRCFEVARTELVSGDEDAIVSLPTTPTQLQLVRRIQALPHTLASLGLQVSTGADRALSRHQPARQRQLPTTDRAPLVAAARSLRSSELAARVELSQARARAVERRQAARADGELRGAAAIFGQGRAAPIDRGAAARSRLVGGTHRAREPPQLHPPAGRELVDRRSARTLCPAQLARARRVHPCGERQHAGLRDGAARTTVAGAAIYRATRSHRR